MVREIDRFEVIRLLDRKAQLVEVLPRAQYDRKHIPGAISLPLKDLGAKAERRLARDRPVITYCYDSLCDMSGRAAARLRSLGFQEVYNYQPSKVDWFGNALPAEGEEAGVPSLADVASRDVPRCGPQETLAVVRDRLADWDVCLVVDEADVLLGLATADALRDGADDAPVRDVMREGPQTHRPDVTTEEMAEMLRKQPEPRVLVTNADGTVIGVADPEQVQLSAKQQTGG